MAENRLLQSLPPGLLSQFQPELEPVQLDKGQTLARYSDVVDYVYFPTTCMVSNVVTAGMDRMIEAGIVGSDGFVGLTAFFGSERADSTAIVQIGGQALRMKAAAFRDQLESRQFREHLGAYASRSMAAMAQSTACLAFHPVEQRLARWLLMVQDATERQEFPLTHELIAVMLGVYRPTVTITVRTLVMGGLIDHRRGQIRIVDRDALVEAACECYRMLAN